MKCLLKILCHLCITKWVVAEMTYFHNPSYIELRSPGVKQTDTDFGFSMGYSKKKNALVIGAPHHDLNGQVFQCHMEDIFKNKTAHCTKVNIDLESLAGDYSRDLAPDQNFCLGASIAVATDYILTCAPLWRTVISNLTATKLKYGTYGSCFIVTDDNVKRFKGMYEQLSELENYEVTKVLGKVHAGTGWSTLIDENNNVTLISLSPLSESTDIGYTNTLPTPDSMKLTNVYKEFDYTFKNIGAFTPGTFFDKKRLSYAISSRRTKMTGVVAFIQQPITANGLWEITELRSNVPIYIESLNTEVGSMFGAALGAADLNSDGFSDLLVGAPAQGSTDYPLYDAGALHIFLGGKKQKIKERRTILATVSGGYFGKTIAISDVDGDGLSEIFVSAPFEDFGTGALYILSGREIRNFVQKSNPSAVISLMDLKFKQRIQNKEYKSFGYSLQPLPDLDGNGCSELAVGAPNSGKVLLYRSIPLFTVNVSAEVDRDYVRERDLSFNIFLRINIDYPVTAIVISETLVVTMKVVGNEVSIDGGNTFEQVIDKSQSNYKKNITVKFGKEEPGLYTFSAAITSNFDEYLTNKVFDNTRVGISPYSNTTVSVSVNRRCKDEECVPILSSTTKFSGGENNYILGSSWNEIVWVTIINRGNDTFDSCVKIFVEGSEVLYIKAERDSTNWYQYLLPKPFMRDASDTIEIQLDMSKQSNLDKKFTVKVALYNICNRGNFVVEEKEFPFQTSTNYLHVNGDSYVRNITDTEISDPKTKLITADHVYTVLNTGNMTWKSVNADVKIKKRNFIKNCYISKSLDCDTIDDEDSFLFTCNFDLDTYLKVVVSLEIDKEMLKDSLQNGQLETSSHFTLYLNQSNEDKKEHSIITTFNYKVDTSFKHNKTVVITGSVVLSAVILGAITFMLYKGGFFKSPEKEKLLELRRESFKRSMKRADPEEDVRLDEQNENRASASQQMMEGNRTSEGCRISNGHGSIEGRVPTEEHGTMGP